MSRTSRTSEVDALTDDAIDRAIEHLRGVLRERGLKNSSVREQVARIALRQSGHFTVDDLVTEIRKDGDMDAHFTTVYRIMPLLVEAGLLQETLVSDNQGSHYERAFEREHHDHLICTDCGEIIEFHYEALEALQRDIADTYGYKLTNHVHELFGVCTSCQGTKASSKATSSSKQSDCN